MDAMTDEVNRIAQRQALFSACKPDTLSPGLCVPQDSWQPTCFQDVDGFAMRKFQLSLLSFQ
jgi:hypothetical protein